MKSRIKLSIVILSLFLLTFPAHASEHSKLIKKANTAFHADDCERAVELYNQALEIDPTDYMAWLNLGFSLAELERYDESLKCYEKAVELGAPFTDHIPPSDEAMNSYKKAWSFIESNNFIEAIRYFEKAQENDLSNPLIDYEIAWAYRKMGNNEKAEEFFEKSIKKNVLYTPPYYTLGKTYCDMGRLSESKNLLSIYEIIENNISP